MKVSTLFPKMIEDAEMLPTDFFMVHAGFFHSYAKKAPGSHHVPNFDAAVHAIEITGFMKAEARFKFSDKVAQEEELGHIILKTKETGRNPTHHSSNVEVFLRDPPEGSTLVTTWDDPEKRSHLQIRIGRITLADLRPSLAGWAFEYFNETSFGMCFKYEADAVLYAGLMPFTESEIKEREEERRKYKTLPSIAHRKLAW